jgi:hypothetical protein
MRGICTLANDVVYDQLIALLNSIDAVMGSDISVCIYPFDDRLDRVRAELAHRPNVQLFENQAAIQAWDEFMRLASPASVDPNYRIYGGHRRFCAFDGPFEQFVYMDADTVLLSPLDGVWQALAQHDCVTYDFQFFHPDKVYNTQSPKLLEVFNAQRLEQEIFCSGFFASKRGLFPVDKRAWLLEQLQGGEAEILYRTGDQPVLNYMLMRSQATICNLAHHLPPEQSTGCAITSSHFTEVEHRLYDHGVPLTYLHYIGVPPRVMTAVCAGENIDFPYRDLYLHYRYRHQPDDRPQFTTPPRSYHQSTARPIWQRVLQKLAW